MFSLSEYWHLLSITQHLSDWIHEYYITGILECYTMHAADSYYFRNLPGSLSPYEYWVQLTITQHSCRWAHEHYTNVTGIQGCLHAATAIIFARYMYPVFSLSEYWVQLRTSTTVCEWWLPGTAPTCSNAEQCIVLTVIISQFIFEYVFLEERSWKRYSIGGVNVAVHNELGYRTDARTDLQSPSVLVFASSKCL